MPIKVNPDGSFTCDTPAEAVEVQRLVLERKHNQATAVKHAGPSAYALAKHYEPHYKAFLESLEKHKGTVVSSGQMVSMLGTTSPMGVGPKLRGIESAMQKDGLSLSTYLEKQPQPDGTMLWRVTPPSEGRST